mgnify:CR=1 FL=1
MFVRTMITIIFAGCLLLGCSGLDTEEQRVLSGGAIGAGSGAALGAITGNSVAGGSAIGAAAGALGGLLYDESQED